MDKSHLVKIGDMYDMLSDGNAFEITETPIASHLVTGSDVGRPDLIALKYYENHNLWWAILKANSLRYSFKASLVVRKARYEQPDLHVVTDIYRGRRLLIPTVSDINRYLNSYAKG